MKHFTILALLFLFGLSSCKKEKNPESGPTAKYFTFSGSMGVADNSTCLLNDGNLVICGNLSDQLSVLKVTKTGSQIWRTDFNAGSISSASGITEQNGEIFVCGKTLRNYASHRSDILLAKLSASGDTLWTKTYGSVEADYSTNIIATSDGNLLISGKTEGFGAGTFGDLYLIKVDSDGNVLWEASYPDQDQESPFHLLETQNGEYLVTGTNQDNSQSTELYLLKVNASGQQLWAKKIGPPTWKWGLSTIETSTGDLVTCGYHSTNFQNQILLVKTDNLGNVLWEKEYGKTGFGNSEQGNSIKENADGTFTITGSAFDFATEQRRIMLMKTDQNGNQIWFKKFTDLYEGTGLNLLKDNDDNIITGNRNGNMFMIKTNSDGVYK